MEHLQTACHCLLHSIKGPYAAFPGTDIQEEVTHSERHMHERLGAELLKTGM